MRVFDWGKKRRSFNLVALDPTGRTLAAGGDYQPTVVWDTVSGAELVRFDSPAFALQFHPLDGRLFLSTREWLRAYDPKTGATADVLPGSEYYATPLAFAPNDDWAVYPLRRSDGWSTDLTAANRFGHPDQTPLWVAGFGDSGDDPGHAFHLACLPGGERFLSAERAFSAAHSQRDRFAVRSRADGRLLHASPDESFGSTTGVLGSPWSAAFVVLDRMRIQVYRSDDLTAPPHFIQNDNRRQFTGAAFHPSGRFLATTSTDTTVKFYDTTTWEVVRTFTWKIGKMRSVCFSLDGALAAAGSDTGKVVVWDLDF